MAEHPLVRLAHRARAQRTGDLPHDLATFTGLLRAAGSKVSPAATVQALRAVSVIDLGQPRDFRAALECCLTSSTKDRAWFGTVYDVFWTADLSVLPAQAGADRDSAGADGNGDGAAAPPAAADRPGRDATRTRRVAGRATWSRHPGQGGTVAAQPRPEIDQLCRRLARALGSAPGRRLVTGPRGETVDVRASLRQNLRFGEELLLLQRSSRRRDRPRIGVLCDVSSSMMPYASLLLAFVHALTRLVRHTEAAVFNVELAVVTEVFRDSTLPQALRWMDRQQAVLAGGTRIGHCLHQFTRHLETCAVTGPATIALVLSDGWDVGDPDRLRDGMRRLRGQAGRVIWCDPHAAAAGYQPQVQGLRVALPYVDDYLDFSSVRSLSELVSRIETGHPLRSSA
ncbi:MAG: VWA domain-containing protein [Actinobacteria bacterium]|nr:VWA domain-containing protein [Actinomycetota bacterium]